jgi:hypothetical protein
MAADRGGIVVGRFQDVGHEVAEGTDRVRMAGGHRFDLTDEVSGSQAVVS